MKIPSGKQIREIDQYTIRHFPIASIDLMERAAATCFNWFLQNIDKQRPVIVICGPGNNGGDGLALTRMLHGSGYTVKGYLLKYGFNLSSDCLSNLTKLTDNESIKIISEPGQIPVFKPGSILVDAIFGSGLTRNVEGNFGDWVDAINQSNLQVVSIDLPSGLYSDESSIKIGNKIVKATCTLTFQYPKLALMVPENHSFFGKVIVLDIGLMEEATREMTIRNYITDVQMVASLYRPRPEFSHKGDFGHGLLVAGGPGKMGAGILSARGYLHSGAGLLTMLVPDRGESIIQSAVPEAMALTYNKDMDLDTIPLPDKFHVIGIGPGIGTGPGALKILQWVLQKTNIPLVLDADALNLLSENPELIDQIPTGSVFTPHPGEFRRLAGPWNDDFHKLELQRQFSEKHGLYLVLKGKNTSVSCPDGTLFFNPTGNPGMAKGGSGDLLLGLVTGLAASGYERKDACILGVYLHGLAGDLAAAVKSPEGMTITDMTECLGEAWKKIANYHFESDHWQ